MSLKSQGDSLTQEMALNSMRAIFPWRLNRPSICRLLLDGGAFDNREHAVAQTIEQHKQQHGPHLPVSGQGCASKASSPSGIRHGISPLLRLITNAVHLSPFALSLVLNSAHIGMPVWVKIWKSVVNEKP